VYSLSLVGGLLVLFGILCLVYWRVPRGSIPWRCVWPGALLALVAMGIVDYGFPLYLSNVSSLRVGTSFLFVLIVLVWFYVLALILLAGAVVNELRFEGRRRLVDMADPKTEELRVEQIKREHDEHARAREADQADEERTHERRAERAEYLREKLDERAESEERVDDDA
jgi:uncharacterized BrkB/YihY/UPF0761 family membrane protein